MREIIKAHKKLLAIKRDKIIFCVQYFCVINNFRQAARTRPSFTSNRWSWTHNHTSSERGRTQPNQAWCSRVEKEIKSCKTYVDFNIIDSNTNDDDSRGSVSGAIPTHGGQQWWCWPRCAASGRSRPEDTTATSHVPYHRCSEAFSSSHQLELFREDSQIWCGNTVRRGIRTGETSKSTIPLE